MTDRQKETVTTDLQSELNKVKDEEHNEILFHFLLPNSAKKANSLKVLFMHHHLKGIILLDSSKAVERRISSRVSVRGCSLQAWEREL